MGKHSRLSASRPELQACGGGLGFPAVPLAGWAQGRYNSDYQGNPAPDQAKCGSFPLNCPFFAGITRITAKDCRTDLQSVLLEAGRIANPSYGAMEEDGLQIRPTEQWKRTDYKSVLRKKKRTDCKSVLQRRGGSKKGLFFPLRFGEGLASADRACRAAHSDRRHSEDGITSGVARVHRHFPRRG